MYIRYGYWTWTDILFVCKVKKTSLIVSRIFQGKMVHVGNEVA
jgi:hypothetical protein